MALKVQFSPDQTSFAPFVPPVKQQHIFHHLLILDFSPIRKNMSSSSASSSFPKQPVLISIGPYHHGNPQLKSMNQHKYVYNFNLFYRNSLPFTGSPNGAEILKELMPEIQTHYSQEVIDNIGSEKFKSMLLLDACFIIKLSPTNRDHSENQGRVGEDPIFSNEQILALVRSNLLLVDNQLPFLVLERFFDSVIGMQQDNSLVQLAIDLFSDCLLPGASELSLSSSSGGRNNFNNLLQLYHSYAAAASSVVHPPEQIIIDNHDQQHSFIPQTNTRGKIPTLLPPSLKSRES